MKKSEIVVAITSEEMEAKNFIFSKATDLDKSYNIKKSAIERAKLCFEAFGKLVAGEYSLIHSEIANCYNFCENGVKLSRTTDLDYAVENFVDWASWA